MLDIIKYSLYRTDYKNTQRNDNYKAFLKSKLNLSFTSTIVDTKSKKSYSVYRNHDLSYFISDIDDNTVADIPKMFIKYKSNDLDDILRYINENICVLESNIIRNITRNNFEYQKVYSKALSKTRIDISSKVLDSAFKYRLEVKYRDDFNLFNSYSVTSLKTEASYEFDDLESLCEMYDNLYAKYSIEEKTETWNSFRDGIIYAKLLGEKIEDNIDIYPELLSKYFGKIDNSNVTVLYKHGALYNYESNKHVVTVTKRFYDMLLEESKYDVILPERINMYIKHILNLPDDVIVTIDYWSVGITRSYSKQIILDI